MKKLGLSILVLLIISTFTACGYTEVPTSYGHGDYEAYSTVESLVDAAEIIYEGVPKKVWFDVQDDWICTFYEIEITKTYKGKEKEKSVIMINGGNDVYSLAEQYKALNKANVSVRRVDKTAAVPELGKNYLFVIWEEENGYDRAVNPAQFALASEDSNSKNPIDYSILKNYLIQDSFVNPKVVPTEYINSTEKVLTSPKEIIESADRVFEGIVDYMYVRFNNGQMYTYYWILPIDENEKGDYFYINSFSDNYDIMEQYRRLNRYGISVRKVYRDLITLESGKTYLFTIKYKQKNTNGDASEVINPAQFAFATDDSNAPGGVTYSMIKEYLKNK